ncbi:MAG: glycosyltransferase family 2 protein [Gemmatimonadetes bacterium]|nr:glycosyltransferase family 2 protein [Gemmatimonadota bacterium]
MSDTIQSGISVVLPAYNEEDAVGPELAAVIAAMEGIGRPFEVIVVDDGSDDATGPAAVRAGARVLRHAENRGYGASLKTGIDAARYETIVMKDADGSYPAEAIPGIVEALDGADQVVGARIGKEVNIPLVRRPAKWFLRWFAALVAGKKIPDINSGLRAIHRDTIRQYFAILPDQFSFTTTMTLAYFADGYRIRYVPIDYLVRVGKSKIRPWHFVDFVTLVIRIAMLFQPLRVFVPLSAVFGTIGIGKAVFDVWAAVLVRNTAVDLSIIYQPVFSTSAILLILVGFQLLTVGMVADGVLRRIAQQRPPLAPSRAISTLSIDPDGTAADSSRAASDA